MKASPQFDPFNDRLSRDIRNDLSSSLVKCLETGDIAPAEQVAAKHRSSQPDEIYLNYISERVTRYSEALQAIRELPDDPLSQAVVLWDLGLFFEVHEVLEHAWYDAEGEYKLTLQALIRAAGVYIKLECGFIPQAERIAAKAVPVLEEQKERLQSYFTPELLIDGLKGCRLPPPKLMPPR
jgi:hypothetical protein